MNKMIGIVLIIALVFALGCTQTLDKNTINNNAVDANLWGDNTQYNNLDNFNEIKDGDNVTLNYTLSLADGSVYQTTVGSNPATFDIKYPGLIKGFYDAVIGMKVRDKKTVVIPPEEAYGQLKVEYIDLNNFDDPSQVQVGGVFNSESNGRIIQIKIVSIDDNAIGVAEMLSGETLTYDIEIISIN